MSQQTFAEMSEAEFDALIDSYVDREAAGHGEMPVEIFFDLLLERSAAEAGGDPQPESRGGGQLSGPCP